MGTLAIARDEIGRRWLLWPVALGLGLVPTVCFGASPVLLDVDHYQAPSHVFELCVVWLVIVSWTAAFVTGMGLLGRPLHDGRLAFYFTRPIGGLAIAAGKLLGGAIVIAGMELLLLVPMFGSGDGWLAGKSGIAAALAIAGVFLAAGLVVGILARSRSRWFLVDAIGATVVAFVVVAMFDRINDREMRFRFAKWHEAQPLFEQVELLLRSLVLAAITVMVVAAGAAIAVGRTDRERVHRTLSITLWAGLCATSLVGLAFSTWGLRWR
jgi:hypothetical protein